MASRNRLLFVEDMSDQARPIIEAFSRAEWELDWVTSFAEAIERLSLADVVLCDRNLPDGDGIALLKVAREKNIDAAFIMLTAIDTIEERVRGLELGAADYVGKGVDVREVIMRCEAQARNVARNRAIVPDRIVVGAPDGPAEQRFVVLPADRLVAREHKLAGLAGKRERQPYTLEPTAFAILMHLVRRQGHVVPVSEIEERFFFRTEHTRQGVRNAVSKIRRCVDDHPGPIFLHTHMAQHTGDEPGYVLLPRAIPKGDYPPMPN